MSTKTYTARTFINKNMDIQVYGVSLLVITLFLQVSFLQKGMAYETTEGVNDGTDTNQQVRALLVPNKEAKISSQMNGRIASLNIKEGESFKKNDILVTFDCDEPLANLKSSKAQYEIAKTTYQIQRKLNNLSAGSRLDLAIAEADVEKTKAMYDYNQVMVKHCTIYAPFNGWVVERIANEYENVTYGTPLISIIDNEPLKLDLFVPSEWLSWLSVGKYFQLTIDETRKNYQGVIKKIIPKVDSASQTVAVKAYIANQPPELIAGMSGTADFTKQGL
ncbi:efflux RND transporter periplasmic adaptor subunit [Zooshikella ganghwensis]|uniref:Efflux RND transporter periplasmic adaptor subunit n=1 Tax=Zooshikella ganghwensis TaxID=202772 RepID=A0A4P9VTI0_9GAMM|nr:efflux RND transporter periplasmic adaptor subunit [Zooshikella ganghwensis]RDH45552.1 efflux RND transporter periplasmic adaptor subunit [Zooshikella ganghwensis]